MSNPPHPSLLTGSPPTLYPLARTLLLASGDWATAVVSEVIALSHRWLGGSPPLRWLDVPPELQASDDMTAQHAALVQACDELASHELLHTLQAQGYGLNRQDELHVWLVFQLPDVAATAPAALATLLPTVVEIAWQRLRIHTQLYALLLSEPAQEHALEQWLDQLQSAGVSRVYVAGPVNQCHLRLSPAHWQAQAATALAALLCSHLPNHEDAGTDWVVRSIGAVAWLSPRALLTRWLALYAVQTLLHGMLQAIEVGVIDGLVAPLAPSLQPPPRLADELATQLPAPPERHLWRNRWPTWSTLPTLDASLLAELERRGTADHTRLQQARQDWLGERLAAWNALLTTWLHPQEPSQWTATPLSGCRQSVAWLQTRLQHSATAIDERLAAIEAEQATAQATLLRIQQLLAMRCAALPAPTVRGGWAALLQPWRWPRWAWHYLVRVPTLSQQLLDAYAACQQLRRQQDNWLLLRQLYLAQWQDLRQVDTQLAELEQCVRSLATTVATELATLEQQLPPPWTPAQLTALAYLQPADGLTPGVQALLTQWPVLHWLKLEPATLLAQLVTACTPADPLVQRGTAADWLLAALTLRPASADAPGCLPADAESETRLAHWLDGWLDEACPLWPPPEAPATPAAHWLLLPRLADGVRPQRGFTELRAWAAAHPTIHTAESCTDGLIALHWVTLRDAQE